MRNVSSVPRSQRIGSQRRRRSLCGNSFSPLLRREAMTRSRKFSEVKIAVSVQMNGMSMFTELLFCIVVFQTLQLRDRRPVMLSPGNAKSLATFCLYATQEWT